MPIEPTELIFTEEAVVLMDLVKTAAWKSLYEVVSRQVRGGGRGMVTLEDVIASLDDGAHEGLEQVKRAAETFVAERTV